MDFSALSPLDGRYQNLVVNVAETMSEAALIRNRIRVEALWLIFLNRMLKNLSAFDLEMSDKIQSFLEQIAVHVDEKNIKRIKEIEVDCEHDVKAVEYFLREELEKLNASKRVLSFIHFALTSEDVNNCAYALMLKNIRDKEILPLMEEVQIEIKSKAKAYSETAMLSFTHGQKATPTTLGKEFAVFGFRLKRLAEKIASVKILGKFNGAVGCYNAHTVAFPDINWQEICKQFVCENLNLDFSHLTTQIEDHDYIVEFSTILAHYNSVAIGFAQDIWTYIMKDYLQLKPKDGQVGSSTMPHKVNPIDFENAEGNFGVSSSLGEHFARKLPISRLQRDLSDSTVLRSLGVFIGHHIIAQKSILKGLRKITANTQQMHLDLTNNWSVLAEPIQTLLRKEGVVDAYERLKTLTMGLAVDKNALQDFIKNCPELDVNLLDNLKPETYLGKAKELAIAYANAYS